MASRIAKNKKMMIIDGTRVRLQCPGCKSLHVIYINDPGDNGARWQWDGNMESPTFSPSILVTWEWGENNQTRRCHSFIRNGQWEFLGDSWHDKAGQTVPMIELPEWALAE